MKRSAASVWFHAVRSSMSTMMRRSISSMIWNSDGWRLSPAYDLNPVPVDVKPRILATAINEDDNTASLSVAMGVVGYFELDDAKARDIAAEIAKATSKWRDQAAEHGISRNEIDRMASAFEHDDLKEALGE